MIVAIFCTIKAVALPFICRRGGSAEACVDVAESERDFSNWITSNAVLGGSVTAYDDATLTDNGLIPGTDEGVAYQALVVAMDASLTYRYEVYAKAEDSNWIAIRVVGAGTTDITQFFDVATPAIGANTGGGTAAQSALPNGWYKNAITFTNDGTGVAVIYIYAADADNDISISTGDDETVWHYSDMVTLCTPAS